jgi:hypothetical protein
LKTCPNCGKTYTPKLTRPEGDRRCIQDIYPDATREEREQLISGICSNKCWNEYLGMA